MSISCESFDEHIEKNPDLNLCQLKFKLTLPEFKNNNDIKTELLNKIAENEMAPWYEQICAELKWKIDNSLLSEMKAKNEKVLKEFNEQISEAENDLSDTELREAYLKKAQYLSKICDEKNALNALELAFDKTTPTTHKVNILFQTIRIGLFFMNHSVIEKKLEKAEKLIEDGGNWDLRNKLKVYKGLYMMSIRKFKEAADLFLETTSTFTSYEILEYNTFIKYTILIAMVALNRTMLKEKIVKAPEILTLLHTEKSLKTYITSLYDCQYETFFQSLADVEQDLKSDFYLNPHYRFYVREMKIKAYSQLLESYRSLSLTFMAESFGVTPDYIDNELSRFIAIGRICCKIDRVGGVVETCRSDFRNPQFHCVIRQGDLLLNRVQKLSRVINI